MDIFFFNDTATTEIYTLSLHDALPISYLAITLPFVSPLINYAHLTSATYEGDARLLAWTLAWDAHAVLSGTRLFDARSEEHTSELQSRQYLVCRLLLEKKNNQAPYRHI